MNKEINLLKYSNEESHQMTIEAIQDALILLMNKKPYNKITICELVEKAGVSRTAFYKNYQDKDEVLKEIIFSIATEALPKMNLKENKPRLYWKILFEEFSKHKEIITCAVNNNLTELMYETNSSVAQYVLKTQNIDNKYYSSFYCGAVSNVAIEWLKNGMKESPEEMAEILLKLIP